MVRIIENYTLYEVIGEGAYGKVYRATNKLDSREYAIKVIEVKKFQSNKKLEECTVNQINILTNIQKNQHIIAYYDMLKTQNNFYFIYEYCNGGTLEGMLRKSHVLDQKTALLVLKQLLEAFKLLNKYNIMHRDLKPDNIFFHNNVLKVGDFGFCKSLEKAKMTKTMLGSPIYMAPQILKGEIYSTKADIWSIGVVLYEMLYGFCPFESTSIPKLIEVLNETELQFPDNVSVSNQTKNLLRRILTKDPTKRIEWMQLFQQKITNQGKLAERRDRLSLMDDDSVQGKKPYRQVSQTNTQEKLPQSITTSYSYKQKSYNAYTSPRNVQDKDLFIKRGTYEANRGAQSPHLRKAKSGDQIPRAYYNKQRILATHNQIIKGVGIARNLVATSQKHSMVFTFYIFRTIMERLIRFRDEIQQMTELREVVQITNKQIGQIDIQLNNLRGKVQQSSEWKRVLKSKVEQSRNIKLCYQMIMFLLGENPFENLSQTQMQNNIRSKLS